MLRKFLGLSLALVALCSARAEVQWDTDSLRLVYEPHGRFYCYAPSVVVDGEREWIWACHNAQDGVIRDHIYFFKSTAHGLSDGRSVLQGNATPGAWDGFHVCDPSIIAGDFRLGDARFRYAMCYLGNNVDASANNEIGVAFANDPGGPWTRYPQPIVAHPQDRHWGVGQPSLTRNRVK